MPRNLTYTYSEIDPFLTPDSTGNIVIHYDDMAIYQWIMTVLGCISGENVRSSIGSRLVQYLFEPETQSTANLIKDEIRAVITDQIPPILTVSVDVRLTGSGYYAVTIQYTADMSIEGVITKNIRTFGV